MTQRSFPALALASAVATFSWAASAAPPRDGAAPASIEERSAPGAALQDESDSQEKDSQEKDAKEPAKDADDAKDETGEKDEEAPPEGEGDPEIVVIPPLAKDELPRRTRPMPDPREVQFVRDAVWVSVEEKVHPRDGIPYTPSVTVVGDYLEEYLRRAGHPIAATSEAATYRLEGRFEAVFDEILEFRDRPLAWQYRAAATVRVFGPDGEQVAIADTGEFERESSRGEKAAVLEVRRFAAKLVHDTLSKEGGPFTDSRVVGLIGKFREDPLEAVDPLPADLIVERLADLGLRSVPYLLEALTNTEPVLADAIYPGLEDPDDLKVYHMADRALEEIFQKVSRMGLATTDRERFVIIRGWENEWRRFCPPFRESPAYAKWLEAERRRRERYEARKRAEAAEEKTAETSADPGEVDSRR